MEKLYAEILEENQRLRKKLNDTEDALLACMEALAVCLQQYVMLKDEERLR